MFHKPIVSFACLHVSWRLAKLLLIVSLLAQQGCGGGASGGEQTVINPSIDISGATLRVNNVNGSDSADGITQAYQTLQHALDQLRPGDVLVIEDSGQPYTSNAVIGEQRDSNDNVVRTLRGFKVASSGSQQLPIIIEGRGVNRPVIDQQQTSSIASDAVLGLYLDCVSHIVIRNVEIRNANEAGISSAVDGRCETSNIAIEENHIHHIYGEKYVGGIRMMGVSDLSVNDNHLHDIFSNETLEAPVLAKQGNGITNLLIQNNRFENIDVGVRVNAQGFDTSAVAANQMEAVTGLTVANNVFNQVGDGVLLQTHIADSQLTDNANSGQFVDSSIYGNVFDQLETAVRADVGQSQHQSQDFCIFNNTLVNTQSVALSISGVSNIDVFNMLFSMPQDSILQTIAPANALLENSVSYSDNNLFWDIASLTWRLDNGGVNDSLYPDWVSWQSAGTHPELNTNPDNASQLVDPQFVDALNADYRLLATSPALNAGRFGLSIGADFTAPLDPSSIANPCIASIE